MHTMPPRIPRRAVAALAALLVTVAPLAACGGDDDASSPSTTTAAGSAGSAAADDAPVTVDHIYGSTTVEGHPERIVSLDTQWTDVLIALDEPPAGYILDPNVEGGTFPWRGDQLAGSEGIEAVDALPFEKIASLRPDLILVSYLAQDEAAYEQLSAIAPTVPYISEDEVTPWQDMAGLAGRFLGKADEAAQLVDDAAADAAALAAELPGLDGTTFALANYVPGDAIYVVADPDDGASLVFGELGMAIGPSILDAADDVTGRAKFSAENIGLLDADVLVIFTNGADPADIPGYDDLPAVRSGAVAVLDYGDVVGLNTPTPLSVPYALDKIHDALVAAAG